MSVHDDLDKDRTVRIACCWICGQMRNDRCTGLYHKLVDILSTIYPPLQKRDEVDKFKRVKVWPFVCGYRSLSKWECRCGSLALAGPIGDGKGTVWNPDWNGARVSFVQSYLVQKADQERMKADMLDYSKQFPEFFCSILLSFQIFTAYEQRSIGNHKRSIVSTAYHSLPIVL